MSRKGPGFAVLYRWKLHSGMEDSFVEACSRVSALLLKHRGSLGSRLHRGDDGIWVSYAQWPSAAARTAAFAAGPVDAEASSQMRAAIAETFPEIVLESVADFMVATDKQDG
ncbi:MAG: antibiotic biosynthesis monooxygenase [Betaproteobacteria bacterium]